MAERNAPLEAEIRRLIGVAGADAGWRNTCGSALTHPRYGYYVTRDPFGAARRFHHRA